MLLRRTAATLTGIGLALTLGAAPAGAHEGHDHASPNQKKDVFPLTCEGLDDVTIQVTSVGEKARGVGRIIAGGKGVVIPTFATFELRNETTGEVLESGVDEFTPGQRDMGTTTCRTEFFRGTVADIAAFDPEFAAFLRDMGVAETDVVVAELSVEVLLRGPIAKSGRR